MRPVLDKSDPINKGLVGWWPLNEAGGGRARDISGYQYNGALTNGPTRVASLRGKATRFANASSQYVNIGTPAKIKGLQNPLTVTAWIRPTSVTGYHCLWGQYLTVSSSQMVKMIRLQDADIYYFTSTSSGGFQAVGVTGSPFVVNAWHFVSLTTAVDKSTVIGINGKFTDLTLSDTTSPTPDTAVNFYIGGHQNGGGEWFEGDIVNVRMWERVLPKADLRRLYREPWAGTLRPANRRYSASSPDVTVALTGSSSTGSVGTLAPGVASGLSGTAATGSVGTLADGVATPLTGTASTGATGTLTPGLGAGLTGSSATGAVGTLAGGVSVGLGGSVSEGSVGTLGVEGLPVTVALTGVESVGHVGTITASISGLATDTHDGFRKRSRRQKRIDAIQAKDREERLADAAELRLALEAALGLVAETPEAPPPVVRAVAAVPKPDQIDWRAVVAEPARLVTMQRQVGRLMAAVQAWDVARALAEDDEEVAIILGMF